MTITPFLALHLRSKKDTVRARQRARRVASLLHFSVHEQTCIAAGAFVIACQAIALLSRPRLCFQIDHQQLQIFATEEDAEVCAAKSRLAGVLAEIDHGSLYRMTKPLPAQQDTTEELDIGWLVQSVEKTSHEGLFDEFVKQNQEVLALLHELRLYQGSLQESGEKPTNPHAA